MLARLQARRGFKTIEEQANVHATDRCLCWLIDAEINGLIDEA